MKDKKPPREAIVDAINRANASDMCTLRPLICDIEILEGHDEIVAAWNERMEHLEIYCGNGFRMPPELRDVPESVMAQKEELEKKYPPLSPGTKVKVTELNEDMRDQWSPGVWESKKPGASGEVLTHHDSHGLCYEVEHEDGTVGDYDPSELETV